MHAQKVNQMIKAFYAIASSGILSNFCVKQ